MSVTLHVELKFTYTQWYFFGTDFIVKGYGQVSLLCCVCFLSPFLTSLIPASFFILPHFLTFILLFLSVLIFRVVTPRRLVGRYRLIPEDEGSMFSGMLVSL
jgi:hypothetical protein